MSDLDDFFAKKDKTKRKQKKGGLFGDELDKKFEAKISEKSREKFSSNLGSFIGQDDGEWDDFKDEDNKDYSGLKIQALSMKDKEEEQREEEESIKKQEQTGTPWQKAAEEGEQQEQQPQDKEDDTESKPKSAPEEPNDDAPLFLKPMRMSALSGLSGRGLAQGPRINDTMEFPDLGTPSEAYDEPKGYQTVRNSSANKANSSSQNNESISTDNKYSALRNSN